MARSLRDKIIWDSRYLPPSPAAVRRRRDRPEPMKPGAVGMARGRMGASSSKGAQDHLRRPRGPFNTIPAYDRASDNFRFASGASRSAPSRKSYRNPRIKRRIRRRLRRANR